MSEFEIPEVIFFILVLVVALLLGIVGAWLAEDKGRSRLGWFVLCTICPLFIIPIALLGPKEQIEGVFKQCPSCKEFIKWETKVCKHCRTPIQPANG